MPTNCVCGSSVLAYLLICFVSCAIVLHFKYCCFELSPNPIQPPIDGWAQPLQWFFISSIPALDFGAGAGLLVLAAVTGNPGFLSVVGGGRSFMVEDPSDFAFGFGDGRFTLFTGELALCTLARSSWAEGKPSRTALRAHPPSTAKIGIRGHTSSAPMYYTLDLLCKRWTPNTLL